MRKRYQILYRNGFMDDIVVEGSAEKHEGIGTVTHRGFLDNQHGVLRLPSDNRLYLIRLDDVVRVTIKDE